jgi:hypothetical protein
MPVASAVGSYSGSATGGILTDSVTWRVTANGIRLTGVRARFTTCHRVWLFFSKCSPDLSHPTVLFGVWTPVESLGEGTKPIWTRTVTLSAGDHVTSAVYSWQQSLTRTFPYGAYFSIQLYARGHQNGKLYLVANAGSGAVLSTATGRGFRR